MKPKKTTLWLARFIAGIWIGFVAIVIIEGLVISWPSGAIVALAVLLAISSIVWAIDCLASV